ncbi:MAG: translocation/assembly module TamB domain-containing protein [Cyclobacteriaceae bacterium]
MNRQVIKNRILKILAYSATSLLFLVISAFLFLQIPAIQEKIINRYLRGFSDVTGFQTSIEDFQLLWFDRLELTNLEVFDLENNRMIGVKNVLINFQLSQLFEQRDINVDGVYLDSADVFITRINESDTSRDLNINVFINRINENYAASGPGTGRSPRVNIGEAILNESAFAYVDQDRDSVKTGFNYNQFSFDINEAQLKNFLALGDTIQFKLQTLLATENDSQFKINQLSTFFRISQQCLEFIDLDLKTGKSSITDTVLFTFNGRRELNDFNEKVNVHANFKNTVIYPEDLALFAPEARRLTRPFVLNGVFDGRINNFKLTEMELITGNSVLKGALDMEGLPLLSETFTILELKNSTLDFEDLKGILGPQALDRLRPLGQVNMNGQFLGYFTDFVATGNFSGDLGDITSDINFKVNEKDFNRSVYSGKIGLQDFDLGTYLKDTLNFQRVSLDGNVKGSGLTLTTADFKLDGNVALIGIRDYNYRNIKTNARFASEFFNGFFSIDDPNLKFRAEGSIDLRNGINEIRVRANIDTALFQNLKLTQRELFIRSNIDVNIKGLHLDSIVGTADIKDFHIIHNGKSLSLDVIQLISEQNERNRAIHIQSSVMDGEIHGDFLLSDLTHDLQTVVKEIVLNIRNDEKEITSYYDQKSYKPKSYETAFRIRLKNVEPVVQLFNLDLLVSANTLLEGKFTSGYTTILQAYSTIDSLAYNKALFVNTEVEVTASKIADSTNVLAMAFLNSNRQFLTKVLQTRNLVAEAIWNNNEVAFSLDADQQDQTNYVRLKGDLNFMNDSTQLRFLPSTIKILEKNWDFDPNNLITIRKEDLKVEELRLKNNDQFVLLDGTVSRDPKETLSMKISELDLSILNPITGKEITGTLNALFLLNSYYEAPQLQNDIRIDSLTVDKFLIGDVTGKNLWDPAEKQFLINFFIDRNENRIVNLNGFYDPSRTALPLEVSANLEAANLKIVEPFFDDMFTNIGGTITGNYRITGNLESPAIEGEGKVTGGQIMVNYLKTTYQFTGIIGLSPNSIYFKNLELSDLFKNQGRLNATITHQDFHSMRINLDAAFRNFQVLNTTEKDNSLFYGQGYATGDLNITGPISNLRFTANARTDKNTRLYIPIGSTTEIEKKDFIRFVNFSDSTYQSSLTDNLSNKLDLTGIQLDFNLDVTPDALFQIIFDYKSGDIISGYGNGEIQLQLDTKGEFNMFGPFEFTEGKYNFTLYDIINKDFQIQKGSRITWFGDPYAANLDISATYNQLASFAPILTDQSLATLPQLRRKYPVMVLLEIDGPMLSPLIEFDIQARDLPQSIVVEGHAPVRLDFDFQAFKNKLDEQELKRQVFSLVVLRKFSPLEASLNTSGSIVNSVSELLSNQLSNWISQVDENLEIDLDLSTLDEEAYNTFQLRLSYTFMNGRLRVTRDGTFYGNQNNTNINNNQNLSSIAGDWTVDYLLTADGKLKVKMYNRTNINPILNTLGSQNSVTTGVSISHTQTFNELKDIWRSARARREQDPDADTDENEEAILEEDDGGGE